ncbi:hypothetical protein KO353_01390 [Elioraea tepida]|jgi:hypothetical protein|uniref:Heme utilization protein n=1 Tax=Elioraea tepida TaxID=2843330 RepID=A0A975U2U9_9PROT|nr:hypothetical protein [Elioraea tepida]QXM24942.1 hypothetical protein KO353_01390 [Elioraea tepida]
MKGLIAAVAVITIASVGVASAQMGGAGHGAFDGAWVIDVVTDQGPCGRGFAGDYTISGGQISGRFSGAGGIRPVTGSVGPDGTLVMRIGGSDGLVLRGRLQWRVGWGEWESPACSGRFMTNRR